MNESWNGRSSANCQTSSTHYPPSQRLSPNTYAAHTSHLSANSHDPYASLQPWFQNFSQPYTQGSLIHYHILPTLPHTLNHKVQQNTSPFTNDSFCSICCTLLSYQYLRWLGSFKSPKNSLIVLVLQNISTWT